MKNIFRAVTFTVFGVVAVYFYFSFGTVNVGAPEDGSAELMDLKAELDRQHELVPYEDGRISVIEFAILGYTDITGDVSIYTLRYEAEGETVSVVPVIMRRHGDDGVQWDEFEDASYAEQFEKLPSKIQEILTNAEEHNALVEQMEAKANAVLEKYKSGWYTYKNIDFNYQIDFPVSWMVADYQDVLSGLATAAAFDPVKVIDSQEYGYFDIAPGAMWIFVIDSMPSGPFTQVKIGDITASYQQIVEDENGPNPWWKNKTDNRYYLPLPNGEYYHFLTIETNYSNDIDAQLVENLNKMLATFKFL